MTHLIQNAKMEMDKVIVHFKSLLKGVSAGKADPDLLNSVKVECYGSKTPIHQVAAISVLDFQTMQIQPYDPQMVTPIAKALSQSTLNLKVDKAKTTLMLKLPPVSGEGRKKLVKHVEQLAEQQKISLRSVRHNLRKKLKNLEMPKDEKRGIEKKLDVLVKDFSAQVDQLVNTKTKDLLRK